MPNHDQRSNLYAAIDRTTRWVYVEHKLTWPTSGFLLRLIDTVPFTRHGPGHRPLILPST